MVAFPLASVEVQFTVVVPMANSEPEIGTQVTVALPEHKSVAVVVNVTGAPELFVVITVMFDEQAIVGGVESTT